MNIELDYIEKLAKIISENNLTELVLENEDQAIVLKKEKEIITAQAAAPMAVATVPQPQAAQLAVEAKATEVVDNSKMVKITSPMVGTFYKSPSPGANSFVEVGKTVNPGQVVCIIEAMKLMNEIESEVSGKVVEICVEDGQPVEFGQTLMIVEP